MTHQFLLTIALPQENVDCRLDRFGIPVLYTGVGKVNAALRLAEALAQSAGQTRTVINLGSAGSHRFDAGEVVCATRFVERDMDARALGFSLGQTPFEDDIHLETGIAIPGLSQAICYTGDSFVTERHPEWDMDVIDMEAYALAKTCQRQNAGFVALKFITDGANGQAASDWTQAVALAAARLEDALAKTLVHLNG